MDKKNEQPARILSFVKLLDYLGNQVDSLCFSEPRLDVDSLLFESANYQEPNDLCRSRPIDRRRFIGLVKLDSHTVLQRGQFSRDIQ